MLNSFLDRICKDPVYFAYRFIGYGLALFLVVAVLGCATLPPCEKFEAYPGIDGGGNPVIAFDMENAKKLGALITGLSDRTCRLPE